MTIQDFLHFDEWASSWLDIVVSGDTITVGTYSNRTLDELGRFAYLVDFGPIETGTWPLSIHVLDTEGTVHSSTIDVEVTTEPCVTFQIDSVTTSGALRSVFMDTVGTQAAGAIAEILWLTRPSSRKFLKRTIKNPDASVGRPIDCAATNYNDGQDHLLISKRGGNLPVNWRDTISAKKVAPK